MNIVDEIEKAYLRKGLPSFKSGDSVRIFAKIKEGDKERIQAFEGVVLRRNGSGPKETITVRKVSYGVGVERIFPLHSPVIDRIEVVQRGKVRRAKLYYLRDRKGRAANVVSEENYGSRETEEELDDEIEESSKASTTPAQQAAASH